MREANGVLPTPSGCTVGPLGAVMLQLHLALDRIEVCEYQQELSYIERECSLTANIDPTLMSC
jgi:hypothetical protein